MTTGEPLEEPLRRALAWRDEELRPRAFPSMFLSTAARTPISRTLRVPALAYAGAAALAVMGAVALLRGAGAPTTDSASAELFALADTLSADEYWQGPSDILATRADGARAGVLPVLPTFEFSLEESSL